MNIFFIKITAKQKIDWKNLISIRQTLNHNISKNDWND